jgi:methylthioribose-1-phosphate isomerase
LAVCAKAHDIPFYVAAPVSTIDLTTACGDDIVIEVRSERELLRFGDCTIAAYGAQAYNPVFDITPADLIQAIVTDKGIVAQLSEEKITQLVAGA